MAHILLVASSIRGVLNRIGGYASYLRDHGHEVTMVVPDQVKHIIEERGLPVETFQEWGPPSPYYKTWWKKKPFNRRTRLQESMDALQLERFDEVVARVKPDLLLVDMEQHHIVIRSHVYNMPYAILLGWYTIWKRPGLPPMSRLSQPGKGWKGSALGMEQSWWWVWIKKWVRNRIYWVRDAGTDPLSLLKYVAEQCNFPFRQEAQVYQWMIPISYKTLPVITTVTEALELPHDPRPNLYYIGPMIQLDRKEVEFTTPETDATLTSLFEVEKSAEKKTIYCATSSITTTDLSLLHRLIEVMRQNSQWELILGIGKKLKVEQLGELPQNVHPFNWVPQLRVLANADICITHGGINTINECIHFKVPMLVYSGKSTDEPGASARIGFHEVAILGDVKTDTPTDIEHHINQLLTEPKFRENVQRVHDAAKAERPKGAALVDTLLKDHIPSSIA